MLAFGLCAPPQDWMQIHGVNLFSGNAGNTDQMWLRFNADNARHEIGWASGLGISLRVWLRFRAWEKEPGSFTDILYPNAYRRLKAVRS